MKQLSIEEKAKRYDEALKKVKDMLSYKEVRREDMEYLFPALKESEDERIELLNYLYDVHEDDKERARWIAWLEKQSTPQVRTGLEWVNTIDDACDKRYSEEYAHGEYCHEQSFKWGFQEGVDWLEKQKGTEREIEGNYLCNGEQKPVELEKEEKSRLMKKCVHRAYQQGYDTGFFMATTELEHKQEWREEDSIRLQRIIDFLWYNRKGDTDTIYQQEQDIEWLKSLKDRVQPQPQWSEEDEEIHRKCICAMRASACGFPEEEKFVEQVDNWLKSIKDRVQPEQEWSEEDEERQEETIELLETLIDHPKFRNYATTRCVDWLKSLRPQKQWKPSEEQIKAVKEAACYSSVFSEKTIDNLISLSKQLKAL